MKIFERLEAKLYHVDFKMIRARERQNLKRFNQSERDEQGTI